MCLTQRQRAISRHSKKKTKSGKSEKPELESCIRKIARCRCVRHMQELLDFVVGDFILGVQCLHYLVSLLALTVLDRNSSFVQKIASSVQNAGLYWSRRRRRLGSGCNRLKFNHYRLTWRYLSRFWGLGCFGRSGRGFGRSLWRLRRRSLRSRLWGRGFFRRHKEILPHLLNTLR